MTPHSLRASFPSCAPYRHAGQAALSADKQHASNLMNAMVVRAITSWQTLILLVCASRNGHLVYFQSVF